MPKNSISSWLMTSDTQSLKHWYEHYSNDGGDDDDLERLWNLVTKEIGTDSVFGIGPGHPAWDSLNDFMVLEPRLAPASRRLGLTGALLGQAPETAPTNS